MVERGDLIALHEPFCNLAGLGETDVEGRTFGSAVSLLAWLGDQTHGISVFLKDTTDYRHHEVLADRRFPSMPGTRSSSAAPRRSHRPTPR